MAEQPNWATFGGAVAAIAGGIGTWIKLRRARIAGNDADVRRLIRDMRLFERRLESIETRMGSAEFDMREMRRAIAQDLIEIKDSLLRRLDRVVERLSADDEAREPKPHRRPGEPPSWSDPR